MHDPEDISSNDQPSFDLKLVTHNCKNIETSYTSISELMREAHIILLQEHWLYNYQLNQLSSFDDNICGVGKAVDDGGPNTPNTKTERLWRCGYSLA